MENTMVSNGGIQIVSESATAQQIVYLDFDGAKTFYNNQDFCKKNNLSK